MVYHARALEILTAAQNILYTSNMEEDIGEIREKIKVPYQQEEKEIDARLKMLANPV